MNFKCDTFVIQFTTFWQKIAWCTTRNRTFRWVVKNVWIETRFAFYFLNKLSNDGASKIFIAWWLQYKQLHISWLLYDKPHIVPTIYQMLVFVLQTQNKIFFSLNISAIRFESSSFVLERTFIMLQLPTDIVIPTKTFSMVIEKKAQDRKEEIRREGNFVVEIYSFFRMLF